MRAASSHPQLFVALGTPPGRFAEPPLEVLAGWYLLHLYNVLSLPEVELGAVDSAPEAELGEVEVGGEVAEDATYLAYFGARYYDPRVSVWISSDPALGKFIPESKQTSFPKDELDVDKLPGMGGIYNSLNLGVYTYAHLNPIRFVDPDGERVEQTRAGADAEMERLGAKVKWFAESVIKDTPPFIPGVGAIRSGATLAKEGVKRAPAAFVAIKAFVGLGKSFGGLTRAGEFGIKSYSQLKSALQGTGLAAHHLIEKRFAAVMGQNAKDMLSIAVTPGEHQAFTNAWRSAIGYGQGTATATRQQVMDAAKKIYADYPEILKALGL